MDCISANHRRPVYEHQDLRGRTDLRLHGHHPPVRRQLSGYSSYAEGRAVRMEVEVLIVVGPTWGKSSLLNALLMEERGNSNATARNNKGPHRRCPSRQGRQIEDRRYAGLRRPL